jgi:immune inhibitor A
VYVNQQLTRTKYWYLAVVVAAVLLLTIVLSASGATGNRTNPHDFLNGFNARPFPNQIPPAREDIVRQQIAIPEGATEAEIRALMDAWIREFNFKNAKSGPNPIAYRERMADLEAAEAKGLSPKATGGGEIGTAKMLMIPFEFAGQDVIGNLCNAETGDPVADTVNVEGPLHGEIPNPAGSGDNWAVWVEDYSFDLYEDLFFGDGIGVVRTDLYGGQGVDLSGISATNWYLEQSEGLYNLTGEVVHEWVQLPHSVAYYGLEEEEVLPGDGSLMYCDDGDSTFGETPSGRGYEFARDVVLKYAADHPDFDWSEWDVDGNGIVDHLMVIHAGEDNSAGGGTYGNYQLWAHSWDMRCNRDADPELEYGCVVDDGGTPGDPSDDILVGNYTHIPENATLGVVVHEYGHDIGLPDYYAYYGGETSPSHWTVMASGAWNGILGDTMPAPFAPWDRYFFGWEEPVYIDYLTTGEEYMVGQSEPTPAGTEDMLWINLPPREYFVDTMLDGPSIHAATGNNLFETFQRQFDLSGATNPELSFETTFALEEDWDYTYVRASTNGVDWDILLNDEGEYATADPNSSSAWLGPGGLTGTFSGTLHYDLSAYAGESSVWIQFLYFTDEATQEAGIWIDNLAITDGAMTLYSTTFDDVTGWENNGWQHVPDNFQIPHYYLVEWRNDEGSIAQEGQLYNY